MYRVSAKQLVVLVFSTALLAAAIVACAHRVIDGGSASIEPAVIADPTVATDEQNNIEIYRAVSPGVVNITSKGYRRNMFGVYPTEGSGSGAIIDEQGHILTNFHVVQGARELEVQVESDKYPARLIGTDPDNDLAIIKINAPRGNLTLVKLGSSQGLQVGQKVLAIGNPFGLQRTLTTGVISGLERPIQSPRTGRTIEGAIQTDASINPGNSGGPLLNARGEMIGINTQIISPNEGSVGIGFAVPVATAKKIIPDLIAKGYVAYPWLGISSVPVSPRMAGEYQLPVQEGILVGNVYRGSGAAAAGLRGTVMRQTYMGTEVEQIGDIIVAIDGQPIKNSSDLQRVLKNKQAGQTVQVQLLRQDRPMKIDVRLTERPPEAR
ncbi:MAG TPA: trypsin-like peptidase domain-containing protein [Blastocatellia bacterium]|nr:trypsin-like peptidase domain-containing protein [Blastocatellia bacterium]